MTPFILFINKSGMVSTDREMCKVIVFGLFNFRLNPSGRVLLNELVT
jgi:hypothetical protein